MGFVMSANTGMVIGTLVSKKLKPTAQECLSCLLESCNGAEEKPSTFMVDEKIAYLRVKAVLEPVGICVEYYPPPSKEEEKFYRNNFT